MAAPEVSLQALAGRAGHRAEPKSLQTAAIRQPEAVWSGLRRMDTRGGAGGDHGLFDAAGALLTQG